MANRRTKAASGTFILNKNESIHRWYSYLEGYSSMLIHEIIKEIGEDNIDIILDPFGGTGTTCLVASSYGKKSYYCETNPFMKKVIESKINSVKNLRESGIKSKYLKKLKKEVENYKFQIRIFDAKWNGFEKYFENEVLFKIQDLKNIVSNIDDKDSQDIAMILLSSTIVKASKMVRQGDLRYSKKEKSEQDKDIVNNFILKLEDAISDIENPEIKVSEETFCLADDARDIELLDEVDCVITSPPYLNGTNYIRNTKLELKLNNYVNKETELANLHSKGIIAGINNVSKRNTNFDVLELTVPYIKKLEPVAYDKRIPIMVAGYFHDMNQVIYKLSRAMKNNGYLIIDIGDSQFAGIHIPTHELLSQICTNHGFELYDEEILRERRSKNGMLLSQRLLKFRLKREEPLKNKYLEKAKTFIKEPPYKIKPYSGRNWGHPWHSLCSYHGKLKPAIAHFLIKEFTKTGDVVVDPLSGVGTIPLEASLQGRIGIGNDLSELAYVVTKAKVEKPDYEQVLIVIESLKNYLEINKYKEKTDKLMLKYNNFGYNKTLKEYFHDETYREIITIREYFKNKIINISSSEAMVLACFLHVLHGNRPYALSRNSHPLTPYAPTGEFIYKNAIEHILNKVNLTYSKGDFSDFQLGKSIYGDYKDIGNKKIIADVIISSPPFAGSIRFYMQNWMRLWLCGWEEEDFKDAEGIFLDRKQQKNFDVYGSFFQMCHDILKPDGKVILHLGKTNKIDMANELSERSKPYFYEVYRGSENVKDIEKHGIKDKGTTIEHQYLFLKKR